MLRWIGVIWSAPVAACVVGYSICGYTTVWSARLVPPTVRLRDLRACMLCSVLVITFCWMDPSYIVVVPSGFWPSAFCIFPKCLVNSSVAKYRSSEVVGSFRWWWVGEEV